MRLPLLPGLLEDHLEQAFRARQRRVRIADDPHQTLRALEVMDRAIDRAILAATFYGKSAHELSAARCTAAPRALPAALLREQRAAAVFLRLALSTQSRSPDLLEQVRVHFPEEPRSVMEALRFFPVPSNVFDADQRHILDLFEAAASSEPTWMPLALTLSGLCDVKALAPRIARLALDPMFRNAACVALTRMGHAAPTAALASLAEEARQAPSSEAGGAYLQVLAVDPARALSAAASDAATSALAPFLAATSPHADRDVAWAIAAARRPGETCEAALSRPDLPPSLKLRITALTAYPDAVSDACAVMAAREGPVTAEERDVLELALGTTPAEARQNPGDPGAKSSALRTLLLRVLRRAHVPIRNDADRCPWSTEEILASPSSRSVRLRAGAAFPAGVPLLGAATLEVTHPLRGWLYIERAVLAGHPLGLQADDVFRRQNLALTIAQAADELRD